MVWISASDDNFVDGEASGLFSNPKDVDLNAMTLDDNFADLDAARTIYANRADNGSPAVCSREHGEGIYLEACIDTRDAGRGGAAAPLMENGLFFLAERAANSTAVDAQRKSATAWTTLKR